MAEERTNLLAGVLNVIQAQYSDIMKELYDLKTKCSKIMDFQRFQRKFYEKSPAFRTLIKEGLI